MRTKIHVVMMLAAAFAVFTSTQQPPVDAPKDGLPMCIPSMPCVKRLPIGLPKDGGGPLCWPGTPCRSR